MIIWVVSYSISDGGGGVYAAYTTREEADKHCLSLNETRDTFTHYYVDDLELLAEFDFYPSLG